MASRLLAPSDGTGQAWEDFWCTSDDGLRLHARDYGPHVGRLTPVICIPGLTRNARDFHSLALHLASRPRKRRRVLVLSLRGRGQSEYDRDWRNYTVQRETLDVLDVMAAAGIEHAVIVGTSRGGLIAMTMAALRPTALCGVVLNDIGPRIETQGLVRINSQIKRMPRPKSWADASEILKGLFEDSFTDLTAADWEVFAREIFRDKDGKPEQDYDRRLIRSLNMSEITQSGLPEAWPQFEALSHIPVIAIRGENSDILSDNTLHEMTERHPDCTAITVPNRGHAPFLREQIAVQAIDSLVNKVDHHANVG